MILNRGADRAILTHPGLISALKVEDVSDKLLRQTRHLHVASYFLQTDLQPGLPQLFERAHSLGLTTSLDTNYDPSEAWRGFDELLSLTDIFLPNEAEACSLARVDNVDLAADKLAGKVETLAVKLGAAGALGVRNSPHLLGEGPGEAPHSGVREKVRIALIPVKVVDTVGAGDSFDAGFIYGYLNGWPLKKTLKLATVCGALSTQAAGGTTAQPTLDKPRNTCHDFHHPQPCHQPHPADPRAYCRGSASLDWRHRCGWGQRPERCPRRPPFGG